MSAWQIPRLWQSLTARLGLLFALVALVTFGVVGTYLTVSLATQLETRDDAELINKVALIRHLVVEAGSVADIRNNPHLFLDAAADHDKLILLVKTKDDNELLHTHPEQGALPALPILPSGVLPARSDIRLLRTDLGVSARTLGASGRIAGSGEEVQIVVARTTSDRMALLEDYRAEVAFAALAGALVAALLGYLLVRQGLQPIRTIAHQAHSITAHRLSTRLDAAAAPQELKEMVLAFNAMLDRLHDSFQRLSQFSGDLAHDLRTPLNNLMVQTQVALSLPRVADEYQALLASNIEEYERLNRMVENMLFLARAEHAEVAPKTTRLDVRRVLQTIAAYFEGMADEAGVSLRVEASGTVDADEFLLRRAISNITANALRYTPFGGEIVLTTNSTTQETTISVSNTGPGIPAEYIPRLFDRFYRVDPVRSGSASSAGLGLAIVHSIMSMHGGSVHVESILHQRTIFTLTFPHRNIRTTERFITKL